MVYDGLVIFLGGSIIVLNFLVVVGIFFRGFVDSSNIVVLDIGDGVKGVIV